MKMNNLRLSEKLANTFPHHVYFDVFLGGTVGRETLTSTNTHREVIQAVLSKTVRLVSDNYVLFEGTVWDLAMIELDEISGARLEALNPDLMPPSTNLNL